MNERLEIAILKLFNNKIYFKLLAIILLLSSGFAYGEWKYQQGRSDECLSHNGFLLYNPEIKSTECLSKEFIESKGYYIDYATKTLNQKTYNSDFNLSVR